MVLLLALSVVSGVPLNAEQNRGVVLDSEQNSGVILNAQQNCGVLLDAQQENQTKPASEPNATQSVAQPKNKLPDAPKPQRAPTQKAATQESPTQKSPTQESKIYASGKLPAILCLKSPNTVLIPATNSGCMRTRPLIPSGFWQPRSARGSPWLVRQTIIRASGKTALALMAAFTVIRSPEERHNRR